MRRAQAKDISDDEVSNAISALQAKRANEYPMNAPIRSRWTSTWDIQAMLPTFPPKVVLAKLAGMKRRRLIDGCECGCRGDWHFTD